MKTKNIILVIFSAFLANALFGQAITFTLESDFTDYLAEDSTSIIATGLLRPGGDSGSNSYEIAIGNFETFSYYDDVSWNISNDGDNYFNASYDIAGNFEIEVTVNNITSSVTTQPTDWFNVVVFTFDSGAVELDLTGTLDGNAFSLYTSAAADQWDGVRFNFPDNGPGNVGDFGMSSMFTADSIIDGLSSDSFNIKMYLIQDATIAAVPEPAAGPFIALATVFILVFMRHKYFKKIKKN